MLGAKSICHARGASTPLRKRAQRGPRACGANGAAPSGATRDEVMKPALVYTSVRFKPCPELSVIALSKIAGEQKRSWIVV